MRRNNLTEAVAHLEHANRIVPSIEIAHLDLGIIYNGWGRQDEALRELEIAEKLRPGDPVVHWRLGRFYQSIGRTVQAKAEFEKTRSQQQGDNQSLREKLHQVDIDPSRSTDVPLPK